MKIETWDTRRPLDPGFERDWREQEASRRWLLAAVLDGAVRADSGYGVRRGGAVECRANGSSSEARMVGMKALPAWTALRRGRDHGCRRSRGR